MLVVDAHEDIAWNVRTFNRDYTKTMADIRSYEAGGVIPAYNGNTLLGKSEWLRGQVAVIFATLFVSPIKHALGEWDSQAYRDIQEAHRNVSAQLDVYHQLVDQDPQFRLIGTKGDLT